MTQGEKQRRIPQPALSAGLMGWTGAPFGIGALHLWMGVVLATIELTVLLTILGTALYGNPELSRRAIRLLGFLFGHLWGVGRP